MRVRLPEGSRTRSLSLVVDGERFVLSFDDKGEATVPDGKASAVLKAVPVLEKLEKQTKKPKKGTPPDDEAPEVPELDPVEASVEENE